MMWSDDGIVLRLPEAVDELPARRAARSTPTRSTSSSSASCPDTAMFASAVPGVRGAGPAAAPAPARPAHAAVAAAPAGGRPAARWPAATRPSRSCSRPPASASTTSSTCPRCARCSPTSAVPPGAGRRGRDRRGVAVRPVAAVRLDRRLHVRGRRAAGRAAGRRARPSTATCCATCSAPRSCASCIDPDVLADLELELQRLVDGRRARDADEVHDLLRLPRPARRARARRARSRPTGAVAGWVEQLVAERRASSRSLIGGDERVRRRRGRRPPARRPRRRGAARAARPPSPSRSTRPLDDLVARFARTHGPFLAGAGGAPRSAWPSSRSGSRSRRSSARAAWSAASSGPTASSGSGATSTCCASCAAARWPRCATRSSRSTVRALARFLPRGRASGRPGAGLDALVEVRRPAPGRGRCRLGARGRRAAGPPRRLPPRRPRRALHRRRGGVGRRRRRSAHATAGSASLFRDQAGLLVPAAPADEPPAEPRTPALLDHLAAAGRLVLARPRPGRAPTPACPTTTPTVLAALWDLVWAGSVTNDSLAPLRASSSARRPRRRPGPRRRPAPARVGSPASGPPAGRGSVVARRAAARAARPRPPRPPTPAAPAARALRRAHPRGGARRGGRGRLRRRVPRAQGARGAGPGPSGCRGETVPRRTWPRSSRAFSTGYTPANPPSAPSPSAASRVSTP